MQITRELPIGWYAIYVSDTSRLIVKEFRLVVARDNVVRRTLLAEVTPAGTGQVRLDPWNGHAGLYRDGEPVRLTVDPASCYRFVRWQGDLSGANNPSSIRMLADRTVHAVFERVVAHDDGDCAVGSVVQPDHYCRYPGTSRLFSVSPTSGAQSPWSPELNRTGIKVDPFVDGEAQTFQAEELADRS